MDRQQKNISSELPEIQVRTWPLVEFRSRSYRKEKVRQNTLIHLKSAYWLGSGLNLSPSLMSLRSRVGNDPLLQLCVSSFISGKVSSKDYNSIWPWILPWGRMLDLRSSKKKVLFYLIREGSRQTPTSPSKNKKKACVSDGWTVDPLVIVCLQQTETKFLPSLNAGMPRARLSGSVVDINFNLPFLPSNK